MIETRILIDKPNLSLQYGIEEDVLIGDNTFNVKLIDIGDEPLIDDTITIIHDSNLVVTPSSFSGSERPTLVTVELAEGAIIEPGNYNFSLQVNNEYAKDQYTTSTVTAKTLIDFEYNMEYKLKYFIQRDGYRLNIYQNVVAGSVLVPIEINGQFEHKYQDRTDLFSPVVSATLAMKLEASVDLSLEDLYSEAERTFKVELLHGSTTRFIGYMLPDNIWADFVNDKWILEITANDGLSTLKNISFSNENGTNIFGRMTAINIIDICLRKTGLTLYYNIFCELTYNGGWNGHDYTVFSNIYLSTERYVQNKDEPMDCQSVLQSILQVFNCSIIQQNGMWYIYRSIDLKNENRFVRYINSFPEGVYIDPINQVLGSEINGYEIFHCKGNQKYSISGSVQAYKVTYEYGLSYNFFINPGLYFEGTGLGMPGWTVNNPDGLVTRDESGHGVRSVTKYFDNNAPALLTLNQSINITAGSAMKLRIEYANASKLKSPNSDSTKGLTFSIGVGGFWLASDGSWLPTQQRIFISNSNEVSEPTYNGFLGKGLAIYEADIVSPLTGMLMIIIWRDKHEIGNGISVIYSISVTGSNQSQTKGIEYLGRQTAIKSTNVKSNVTVYNGDSITDLFVGTIYKADSDTPTDLWTRFTYDYTGGFTPYGDDQPILSLNAEDNLRISPRPMTIFEGDFKGYIDYLSIVTIDGFTKIVDGAEEPKIFQFIKWSYDYSTDITKAVFKEFESRIFNDTEYNIKTYENFGSESKVTLIG